MQAVMSPRYGVGTLAPSKATTTRPLASAAPARPGGCSPLGAGWRRRAAAKQVRAFHEEEQASWRTGAQTRQRRQSVCHGSSVIPQSLQWWMAIHASRILTPWLHAGRFAAECRPPPPHPGGHVR
jgi:hypothetical protein